MARTACVAQLSDTHLLEPVADSEGGHGYDPRAAFAAVLSHLGDLANSTWLPPEYRTYEFRPDGAITSKVHRVNDERWPRRPLGQAIASLFRGELTHAELAEIIALRATRAP